MFKYDKGACLFIKILTICHPCMKMEETAY